MDRSISHFESAFRVRPFRKRARSQRPHSGNQLLHPVKHHRLVPVVAAEASPTLSHSVSGLCCLCEVTPIVLAALTLSDQPTIFLCALSGKRARWPRPLPLKLAECFAAYRSVPDGAACRLANELHSRLIHTATKKGPCPGASTASSERARGPVR